MTLAESMYQAWASQTGNPSCPFQDLVPNYRKAWERAAELAEMRVKQTNTIYQIVDTDSKDYVVMIAQAGHDLYCLLSEYRSDSRRTSFSKFTEWLIGTHGFVRASIDSFAYQD